MYPSVKWLLVRFVALLGLFSALCFPGGLVEGAQAQATSISPESFNCNAASPMPKTECQALVALYNSTEGSHWADQTGWLTTTNPCSWYGVECDDEPGHVTTLYLSNNGLAGDLPAELGNLTRLERLELDHNRITRLPTSVSKLVNLTSVRLNNNQLTTLPVGLGKSNIGDLHLNNNQLTSIPADIGDLTYMQDLDLRFNRLTSLPASLGGIEWLVNLYLDDNQLTSLPNTFGKLIFLEHLSISNNQLTSLPVELGDAINLSDLELHHNLLKSVPATLGKLSLLKTLSLHNNQLTSLPLELGNLINLQTLTLDNNQLASFPLVIGAFPRVELLSLNHNQFASLPSEFGSQNLFGLRTLLLDDNQLTTLPVSLGNLHSLNTLSASNNQLTNLPDALNPFLTRLLTLRLGHNQLTNFPDILNDSSNVRELILNDNRLTSLPLGKFDYGRLDKLDLHNNPGLNVTWMRLFFNDPYFFLASLEYFDFRNTALCEPADIDFQKGSIGVSTLLRNYLTCLKLDVNFSSGAPGSQFTLTGNEFPKEKVVTISVNGVTLGTVQPDVNRHFTVTLSSMTATTGTYVVTADMGVHTLTTFRIAADAPLRPPVGDSTFTLPAGVAYPYEEYLPVIVRN